MSEEPYASSPQRKHIYTRLCWRESVYVQWNWLCKLYRSICRFMWMKARIYAVSVKEKRVCKTRVWWSLWHEISDLFYCVTAICLGYLNWQESVGDLCLSLNVWSGSSLKIWWNVACKLCSIKVVGSSVKIYETWSAVVLRIGALSKEVKDSCQ